MSAKRSGVKMKSIVIIFTCIITVMVAALFLMSPRASLAPAGYGATKHTLTIRDPHAPTGSATSTRTIEVLIAETPAQRERGLSGMPALPHDEGMLFLFDKSDKFTFWMPDMHFAIDMVWIGEDWRVVDVTHHATPESYPKTFSPRIPARYVLEINDNLAKEWGIASGTVMELGK